MNDAQLFDRLSDIDSYQEDSPIPDEIWSAAVALEEVERRSNPESVSPRRSRRVVVVGAPRRLVVALAAFLVVAVLVMAAIIWVSSRDELPDVTNDAPLTPLEVGDALNRAIVSGDLEAARSLYADDATYTHEPGRTSSSLRHGVISGSFHPGLPVDKPLARDDPRLSSSLGLRFNRFDWDGDGRGTGFDDLAADAMAWYAQGVSTAFSCMQSDAVTVVCENVLEGHGLLLEAPPVRDIFTVVDGRITHQEYNTADVVVFTDTHAEQLNYLSYIEANQPDLAAVLFEGTSLTITPETVATHRQLIAEWNSQR